MIDQGGACDPEAGHAATPPTHRWRQTVDLVRDVGIVAAVVGAVVAVSVVAQPQIAVNGGHGWDGDTYYSMAEKISDGGVLTEDAPFVYRVLIPLGAALLFPDDLMLGFRVVNAVAVLVTIILMTVWLRRHVGPWPLRATLMGLFLFHWAQPLRNFFWYPVLVDYWLYPAILAGLLVVEHLRSGGSRRIWLPILCLVSIFAVAVREVGLLIPVAAMFTYNPMSGRLREVRTRIGELRGLQRSLLLPLLLAVLTLVAARVLVDATGSYESLRSAAYWLVNKWPTTFVLGWFLAYGPMLVLAMFYWRACLRYMRDHQAIGAFLVGLLGISWIGGGDTERFLTWGAPVIYVLLGIGIAEAVRDRVPVLVLAVLAVTQAVSARLIWILPAVAVKPGAISEIVFLTPIGNDISVYDVTSWDAAPGVRLTMQLEYAAVALLVLGMIALLRDRGGHSAGREWE